MGSRRGQLDVGWPTLAATLGEATGVLWIATRYEAQHYDLSPDRPLLVMRADAHREQLRLTVEYEAAKVVRTHVAIEDAAKVVKALLKSAKELWAIDNGAHAERDEA